MAGEVLFPVMTDEDGRTSEGNPCKGHFYPGCTFEDLEKWNKVAVREYGRLGPLVDFMDEGEKHAFAAIHVLVQNLVERSVLKDTSFTQGVQMAVHTAQLAKSLRMRVIERVPSGAEPAPVGDGSSFEFPGLPKINWPDVNVDLPELPDVKGLDLDKWLKILLMIAAGYGLLVFGGQKKAKKKARSRLAGMQ